MNPHDQERPRQPKYIRKFNTDPVKILESITAAKSAATRLETVLSAYEDLRGLELMGRFLPFSDKERSLIEGAVIVGARRRAAGELPPPVQGPDLPPLPHPATLVRYAPRWTLDALSLRLRDRLDLDRDHALRRLAQAWASSPSESLNMASYLGLITHFEAIDRRHDALLRNVESEISQARRSYYERPRS